MRLPIIALATALLVSILPASTSAQTEFGVLDIWLKVRESADAPNDKKITLYTKSKALIAVSAEFSPSARATICQAAPKIDVFRLSSQSKRYIELRNIALSASKLN